MITRRTFLFGLGAGITIGALAACNRAARLSNLAELRRRAGNGQLTVGFIPYYEITTDEGPEKPPSGFLVEVFSMFAAAAGFSMKQIRWRSITWASFGALVESGAVDFSIAGTFVTPARANAVAFTRPLFALGNGAAARKDDARFKSVSSVSDLDQSDLRIAVVAGEQSAEYVGREFKKASVLVLDGPDLAAAPRR